MAENFPKSPGGSIVLVISHTDQQLTVACTCWSREGSRWSGSRMRTPRAPCLAMEGKREEPAEQMPAVGAVGVLRWAACRGGGKACGSHLKSGDLPPLWGL